MPWQKDALLNPSNIQPLSIYFSQKESSSQTTSSSSSSGSKISQGVLFFVVILAVIFFISGLLHLLVRFLMKHRPSLSFSQSSRNQEIPNSGAVVQRQLQQLFHLHDSGLDQAFIDALPVFSYKDIMGQKEPFDCAVCLCEFSDQDNLRLLPLCSHAFHIDCIDTWLLSNSTCPLCRGILFAPDFCVENPIFYFDDSRDEDGGGSGSLGITVSSGSKPAEDDAIVSDKRVFSVRLGKFWSTNNNVVEVEEKEIGETSNSNLDARRCYSMGSFQYVVGDSELQVALCPNGGGGGGNRGGVGGGGARRGRGGGGQNGNFPNDDGKRINMRSKGESFSVSKIWLWSKKDKFPSSANTSINNTSLPWTDRVLAA